jgi:hypothetical protein
MDEKKHEKPEDFESGKQVHPKKDHEATDISIPLLLKWSGGLTLAILVVMLISRFIFGLYASGVDKENRAGLHFFFAPEVIYHFPSPQLQPLDSDDMKKWRVYEDSILSSYGWVDEEKQIARIPIRRAMELLISKGFRARNEADVHQ